jgi:hypothetical protein
LKPTLEADLENDVLASEAFVFPWIVGADVTPRLSVRSSALAATSRTNGLGELAELR